MDRWLNKIPARKPQLKIMLTMQMQVNKKMSGTLTDKQTQDMEK